MKGSKNFPDQLCILVTKEVRRKLIAIAYLIGKKGKYSHPAKQFIEEGMEKFLQGMTPKQRRDFEEIYQNVVIEEEGITPAPIETGIIKNI